MEKNLKSADIQLIKKIIPHRYPFLLVDKVVEINSLKAAKGIKNVTFNEPFFQGHFPSFPIMPGVLIVEALAQTAAVMVGVSLNLEEKNLNNTDKFYEDLNIKNLNTYFDEGLKLVKVFALRGVPTTIILNKNKEMIARIAGSIDFEDKQFISWLNSIR